VTPHVIVLHGGSSSGKSSIARGLQDVLPGTWLSFSIDTFVDALPARLRDTEAGLDIAADGAVSAGPEFQALEATWLSGLTAMARAGARVIYDDVFLGGAASQARVRDALAGLDVLWVGVRCDADEAARREAARGDRPQGMAATQADLVHLGVSYDIEVDSTRTEPLACARAIAARLG
jgi:chloramphenicol 3-O phosphotransferase